MPLTGKGEEILASMKRQYGAEKGEQVFYASANAGTITGVHDGTGPLYELPKGPTIAEVQKANDAFWKARRDDG